VDIEMTPCFQGDKSPFANASATRSSLDAIDRNASLMSFISRLWASLSDQICASSPTKRRHRSGKPLDDKFHHCKHATS